MPSDVMSLTYACLPQRAVLRVEGADRAEFLQGLITNDITHATPEQAIFSAMLSAQGKFQFDFFIAADENGYWLETEATRIAALQRMLGLYKLRSQVTLTLLPEMQVFAVMGEGVGEAFGLPERCGSASVVAETSEESGLSQQPWRVAYRDPRHLPMGVRLITDAKEEIGAALAAKGFREVDATAYDRLRIAEGIPEGSVDAVIDRTILLENGYDALHAISFTKGCYVGQEVTARSKHRAVIRKRICRVEALEGALPPAGTLLMAGDREVGDLRSGVGDTGFALVRLDRLALTHGNHEEVTASGVPLRITPLWWHPSGNELSETEAAEHTEHKEASA